MCRWCVRFNWFGDKIAFAAHSRQLLISYDYFSHGHAATKYMFLPCASINFNTLLSLPITLLYYVVKFTISNRIRCFCVTGRRLQIAHSFTLEWMQFCHSPNKSSILRPIECGCRCVWNHNKLRLIGRMSKLNELTYGFGVRSAIVLRW